MKCCILGHFIWVFTVSQSMSLGVSSPQRVKPHVQLGNTHSVQKFLLFVVYK